MSPLDTFRQVDRVQKMPEDVVLDDPALKEKIFSREKLSNEKRELMRNFPLFRREHEGEVGECDITGLWVVHEPEVFARYKREFAATLAGADAVFMESVIPFSSDTFDEKEFLDTFRKLSVQFKLSDEKRALSPQEERILLDTVKTKSMMRAFFDLIDASARERKMLIGTADPVSNSFPAPKLFQLMDEKSKNWKEGAVLGGSAVAVVSAVTAVTGLAPLMRNEKMSRRKVLLGGGAAILSSATAGLARASQGADKIMKESENTKGAGENPLSAFLYHFEDYRSVIGSEGLNQFAPLAKDFVAKTKPGLSRKPRIVIVYGASHRGPILHYLKHPASSRASFAGYQPTFGTVKEPTLTTFVPTAEGKATRYRTEERDMLRPTEKPRAVY